MKNFFLATILLLAVITITSCAKDNSGTGVKIIEKSGIIIGDPVTVSKDLVLVTVEIYNEDRKMPKVRALTSQSFYMPCPECVNGTLTDVKNYTITDSMGIHSLWVIQPSFDNSRMTQEEYDKLQNKRAKQNKFHK